MLFFLKSPHLYPGETHPISPLPSNSLKHAQRSWKARSLFGLFWFLLLYKRLNKNKKNARTEFIMRCFKLIFLFASAVFLCLSNNIALGWLPTVLTVSTPEKGWRTKNEVFVSTMGLSSWYSPWRLRTHLGFPFGSYEYIADCFHGNKQS